MNQWKHSKYGNNANEMGLMVLITGLTNFTSIPAIVVVQKLRMDFQFYMGIFTILTSFMYHTLESLDCQFFIIEESGWHRLDNIGSIVCFQMLFTALSDFRNLFLESALNYFGLLVTMIAQARAPWDLNYTIAPIIMQAFICFIIVVKRQRVPELNIKKIGKGFFIIMFAVLFFILSQDEYKDYLRFYHGMWHTCGGIFSFYFWSAKSEVDFKWTNFYKIPALKESNYKE